MSLTVSSFALIAGLLCPSPASPPAPTILKREVDMLVRALRHSAGDDGSLGSGSAWSTARALAAMGNCHRFYSRHDGPWIRGALDALLRHRREDGSFADAGDAAATVDITRWAIAALRALDPDTMAGEIDAATRYLRDQGHSTASPLAEIVHELARTARTADAPEDHLAQTARAAMGPALGGPAGGGPAPDPDAVVDALVQVVACQRAAREIEAPAAAPWSDVQQHGIAFLLQQQKDGVFFVEQGGQRFPDVGLSGIGLAALQTKPEAARTEEERRVVEGGLAWLREQQGEDGAFGQRNVNYSTCAAVMALAAAGRDSDRAALDRAQHFLLWLQNTEDRGYAAADRDYGSIGYGGDERGDLSNLQFAVDALRRTDLDSEHEAFRKALVFLQRCQNQRDSNDFGGKVRFNEDGSWHEVASSDDGGAVYYPGNSPAGYDELPDGTRLPRSYGSMTYALLKCYILCGLPPTDERVQAAVRWIQAHWTLERNPGVDPALGEDAQHQGLFYSYMVMAQALDLVGIDEIVGAAEASPVDWRASLRVHLAGTQRDDGSWLNERNGRWWENMPLVCTVYALLALDRCSS
ncbi:MAG: prenyltransferase/squalene oxidase repeat-containing protein [Planctomycetota bacterium]